MSARITDERLARLAATVVRVGDYFAVKSSDGKTQHMVTPASCSCNDWRYRKSKDGGKCIHQLVVDFICPAVPLPKPYAGSDAFEGF